MARHVRVAPLVGRGVRDQVPELGVGGEHVVDVREFVGPRREERAPAGRPRDGLELLVAPQRDAGDAANPDAVDGNALGLHGGNHLVRPRAAVLVVAVGDEHDDAPARGVREPLGDVEHRVAERGAPRGGDRLDGLGDRPAVVGGTGDRLQSERERRDDDAVLRAQVGGQAAGRGLHEVQVAPHALAAVHEHGERGRDRFLRDHVGLLGLAVLLEHEIRGGQPLDRPAGPVVDGRVHQDAGHLGDLGQFVRLEDDLVAADLAVGPLRLGDDDAALERVGVGPFDGVGRARGHRALRLAVHAEAHFRDGLALLGLHLRDDADGAGGAGAAERGGDADGDVPGGRGRGREERDQDGGGQRHVAGPRGSTRVLTRTPARARRRPRSSCRRRPRAAPASAAARRRCTRPSRAPG